MKSSSGRWCGDGRDVATREEVFRALGMPSRVAGLCVMRVSVDTYAHRIVLTRVALYKRVNILKKQFPCIYQDCPRYVTAPHDDTHRCAQCRCFKNWNASVWLRRHRAKSNNSLFLTFFWDSCARRASGQTLSSQGARPGWCRAFERSSEARPRET